MMRLSTMHKVFTTVDSEWNSSLAEQILERWEYDRGWVKFVRASANFVCVFRRNGKLSFLRFNDSCERVLADVLAEVEIHNSLRDKPVHIALPIMSSNGKYVEKVETELGTFYAVVFEGLEGKHFEFEELDAATLPVWGSALGRLHRVFKEVPVELSAKRVSWRDNMAFVKQTLPPEEVHALQELEQVTAWAEGLEVTREAYGLIHYDFELDNLYWNNGEVGILDFDDCANYWYVADIAYALRDLFDGNVDVTNPQFLEFMAGYRQETDVAEELLRDLPWFMRMHDLYLFARLYRSVDIAECGDYPEWLLGLRKKLLGKNDAYRKGFQERCGL